MAYQAAHNLFGERDRYPAFKIPMICLPATIDNNVPGSELAIGADTALNVSVEALDRIKQSAMAARRCFVVETMGRYCGYLALMSGLAGGAERVYLHEEGVTLKDLQADVERMVESFRGGRRLYLTIRNERANPRYTTDFMCALFEEEGHDLYDVRQAILGHIQQGGNPSPYDRILATRLAAHCIDFLTGQLERGTAEGAIIGLVEGKVTTSPSNTCRTWSIGPAGGPRISGGWNCARSCGTWRGNQRGWSRAAPTTHDAGRAGQVQNLRQPPARRPSLQRQDFGLFGNCRV